MVTEAPDAGKASTSPGPRGGRPRDPSRDTAIRTATVQLLVAHGYDRLTIDAVAKRAGTGKATVYRRWGSKAELVLDAVTDLHGPIQVPDTGWLHGDIDELCARMSDGTETREMEVMHALAAVLPRDQALADAFAARFIAPRRASLAQVFARAIARGEMPSDKDVDLLTSLIPALMMYRISTGAGAPDPGLARRIATEVILPAATAAAHDDTTREDPLR